MIAPLGQTMAPVAPGTGAGRAPGGFGDLLHAATDQPTARDPTPRTPTGNAAGDPVATPADRATGADRPAWVAQPATKPVGTLPPSLVGKVPTGAPPPAGSNVAPDPTQPLTPDSAKAAAALPRSDQVIPDGSLGAPAWVANTNEPPASESVAVGGGSASGHAPSPATSGAASRARATDTTPAPGDPVNHGGDSPAVATSDADGDGTPANPPGEGVAGPSGCAAVPAGIPVAIDQAAVTPITATHATATPRDTAAVTATAPSLPAIATAWLSVPSSAPGLRAPGLRKVAGEAATAEASDRTTSGEVAAVSIPTSAAIPTAFGGTHSAPHTPAAHPAAPAMPDPVNRHLQLAQDGAWLDGVARDIAATADPAGRLRFTLTPLHLGRLDVQMAPEERGTAVRLVTADPVSHRLLADAQPQLLASAPPGGQITSATIDFAGGQAGAQAFGNQNSGGGAGTGTDRRPAPPPPVFPAPPATPPGADELYA